MFSVVRRGPDRVDLELGGRFDSEAMTEALDDLVERCADLEHGRVLYRIHDVALPTLDAVGVKLSRLPSLLRLLRRIDRIAVVADAPWIGKAGEIEGALIPGIEIRAFRPGDEASAEAWLAD